MAYYNDIVVSASDNGKVKCTLCEEYLLDDNNCITSHLNGDQHMEFYIKRIITCNNIIITGTQPYCVLCKTNVQNLESHVQSDQHKQNLEEIKSVIHKDGGFLNLPNKVKENRPLVYCAICDSNTEFTLKDITEHMHSTKHRRARSMAVQPLNGIFSVNGTDDLWCKIGQICFENYIEIIFEHINDKKHVETLSKIHRLISGQNITIEKYLTDPNEDKAKCHKCDIKVPCNQDNIERHVKGRKHKNA